MAERYPNLEDTLGAVEPAPSARSPDAESLASDTAADALFEDDDTLFDDDWESSTDDSPDVPAPHVEATFEDTVDLWLTRSRIALERALLLLGLPLAIRPTNRPLLIFGSPRATPAEGESQGYRCHPVEVPRGAWPTELCGGEPLDVDSAAKCLASSQTGADSPPDATSFAGETVAVQVANPLLPPDRWIVLWPLLDSLPQPQHDNAVTTATDLPQWCRVRRVVWCVDPEQIAPADVVNWLDGCWPDIPVRIALLQTASIVRNERRPEDRTRVLPNVRRTLHQRLDAIAGHPWTVAGP